MDEKEYPYETKIPGAGEIIFYQDEGEVRIPYIVERVLEIESDQRLVFARRAEKNDGPFNHVHVYVGKESKKILVIGKVGFENPSSSALEKMIEAAQSRI